MTKLILILVLILPLSVMAQNRTNEMDNALINRGLIFKGGSPGVNKFLTSDAVGNYTPQSVLSLFPGLTTNVVLNIVGGVPISYSQSGNVGTFTQTNSTLSAAVYGVINDAVLLSGGVLTSNSTTLISYDAAWTSGDVGKIVAVPYGGNGTVLGDTFISTISAVVNATNITMAGTPIRSIRGARAITDGIMASNVTTFTSASAIFETGDIGKRLIIPRVGLTGALGASYSTNQPCYIATLTATNSITVTRRNVQGASSNLNFTIPGATIIYGSDSTLAFQNACAASSALKKPLMFDGNIIITNTVTPTSGLSVMGRGMTQSIIYPIANGTGSRLSVFTYSGTPTNQVQDCTFKDFQINGIGVTVSTYGTGNKAFYLRSGRRIIIRDCWLRNTSATSIGNDYLQDSMYLNNIIEHGGRQAFDLGGTAGGSGIGLGTGYNAEENVLISGNTVFDCGSKGIFTESQSSTTRSKGIRIIGNDVRWIGDEGISDRACDGTIIANNTVEFCEGNGISTESGFVAGLYSINTLIEGNVCRNHFSYGLTLAYNTGSMTVIGNVLGGRGGNGSGAIAIDTRTPWTGLQDCYIANNTINDVAGSGIYLPATGTTNGSVYLINNKIVNAGLSTTTQRPGVRVASNFISNFVATGNIVYDQRPLGSKTCDYGINFTNGVNITTCTLTGNILKGNQKGEIDFGVATIGQLNYNPDNYTAITGTYTVSLNDRLLEATSGTFTATLPSPTNCQNKEYTFKNSGGGILTIGTAAGTIDGSATQIVTSCCTVKSNGTIWIRTANF